jgi:putative endonuclease
MAEHNQLGTDGEKLAVEYLQNCGYQILETNWRFEKKEIDIIARKGGLIAIVEVKTRSTDFFGLPEESVTNSKQKFLIDAADEYLQQLDFEADVRFDIISIIKEKNRYSIRHIEEAFRPLAE